MMTADNVSGPMRLPSASGIHSACLRPSAVRADAATSAAMSNALSNYRTPKAYAATCGKSGIEGAARGGNPPDLKTA